MQRILAIFLCLLVVITPCHSNEAIAVVAVAIGIWPYFGVETLRSNTDQSMAGMIGWGLGEVGWGPGSTNTDWNVLPLTATRGPIGIKTALAEGYAWCKGAEYYSLLPLYLYLDPWYQKKKIGFNLNVIAYHPYLYVGGSQWVQNAWLVKPLNLSNQGIQTIFEAGIGFAVSGIANVRLSYRKPSWKKTAETLIRLNWPLGLWSGYGVGPVKKRVKREKPKSTQMAKSKQPVQKIGKRKDGIDMVSAAEPKLMPKPVVTASWISGEVGAGKIAKLNLTVANQGKGDLYRFVAETDSRLSIFDQQRLEFGRIPPNGSRTLSFNFPTNPEATSQEVAVLIQFEEYNDYTPDAIMTRLYIVEEERPRFEYAYRIVDGGTERSVGNGDGIIQYGESFDLVLTVRNSGQGRGNNVNANLTLMQKESARSAGSQGLILFGDTEANLGHITPASSTTTRFNIGVKPNNARLASIPLYLTLTDQRFSDVRLSEKFVIPIDKRVAPKIVVIDLDATVIGQTAPIHSGADAQTTIVAQVPQHSRLSINGQLGDWYRIESGDLQGWMHRQSVTTEEVIEPKNRQRPIQPTRVIKVFQQMPPSLTLVAPEVSASMSVAIGSLEVVAVAADDKGVKEVKLTVNGKTVSSRGMKVKRQLQKTVTVKETVPLQYGQNRIKLVAVDVQEQQSEPIAFVVERRREMNELWVLAIGISDYQHPQIPKLNYADDDAQAIAAYFGQIGVPNDHIILLSDSQATVGRVRQALGQLMNQAGKNSTVLIYFSGHGAPAANQRSQDGDGIDKYLLTCEADPSNFYGTALPMDEVAGIFQRLRSDRVVFIADTCYSGAAGGKTAFAQNLVGKRAAPNYDRFLSRVAEGRGRVILTASQGSELSQEDPELGHGIFTYFVLTGLQGAADFNSDGFVTVQEVYQFTSRKVPERADQNPSWKGEESGSIVLGRAR